MKYEQILKNISRKEGVSVKEIENEMQLAIKSSGLNFSTRDFIKIISSSFKFETIYRNFV